MYSADVNNQMKAATEVEVMPSAAESRIQDHMASYAAAMAENQTISLAQRIPELDDNSKISGVSATFSMTDEHGRKITAEASISFTQQPTHSANTPT